MVVKINEWGSYCFNHKPRHRTRSLIATRVRALALLCNRRPCVVIHWLCALVTCSRAQKAGAGAHTLESNLPEKKESCFFKVERKPPLDDPVLPPLRCRSCPSARLSEQLPARYRASVPSPPPQPHCRGKNAVGQAYQRQTLHSADGAKPGR